MKKLILVLTLIQVFSACSTKQKPKDERFSSDSSLPKVDSLKEEEEWSSIPDVDRTYSFDTSQYINLNGTTLETRFTVPEGYQRAEVDSNSFGAYLRSLPLKPHGTFVKLYNGDIKPYEPQYDAVVDLPIGEKDLHQCADAIMRLKAEYLWRKGDYENIHYNFTNGHRIDYSEWMKGRRIVVQGNKSYWDNSGTPGNTYQDFWNYMEVIFNYAGTYSLSKELKPVNIKDIQIGDVFIMGAFPGHAVIVVDVAISDSGERLFLLAQSYMPAQEIQILKNTNDPTLSPWYSNLVEGEVLFTPEWTFSVNDLMRFP